MLPDLAETGGSYMEYTNKVKRGEDGVYRWYYDLDLRQNRYMMNVTFKVLAIIGAFLMILVIFMPSGGMSKWHVAAIVLGCFAFVVLLTLGIYGLMILRRNGFYRYRYDMGPEGIMLWMEEDDIKMIRALGTASAAAGAAAGQPGRGAVSAITSQTAPYNGYTAYKSVHKMVIDRDKNCIYLKLMVGENCVYAGDEDFEFVKSFLADHLPDGCEIRSV